MSPNIKFPVPTVRSNRLIWDEDASTSIHVTHENSIHAKFQKSSLRSTTRHKVESRAACAGEDEKQLGGRTAAFDSNCLTEISNLKIEMSNC